MSSSIAPTDSASSTGRKSKPGKRERQAARSAVSSTGGVPASTPKASQFAAGSFDPVPQPGKFPVVFQTGAGEPARDQMFSLDMPSLGSVVCGLPEKFRYHPSFAQFSADAEIDASDFEKQLSVSFLLRLSQQLVHAHVNMGLPQGDFAPVASAELKVFQSLSAVVSQYGEFSSPALGTRYLLSGYEESVSRLVFAASQIQRSGRVHHVLDRSWLPMSASDRVTKLAVAKALNGFLSRVGISIASSVLEDAVLSGSVPDVWEGIKGFLGEDPEEGQPDLRDRFDFLFKSYADSAQFTVAFTTASSSAALAELNLPWHSPSAGHLDWQFNVKSVFGSLSEMWSRVTATYSRFFEMSSSQAQRGHAVGSPAQMVTVRVTDSVTIVKTFLALSAAQFSLAACFPPSCLFSGEIDRRVVVSTPLPVAQRATEFCQLDWR